MNLYFLPILTSLITLFLWQLTVTLFHIEQWILPAPTQIINSFWQSRSLIFYHLIPTVIEAIIGLIGAVFVSIFIAILMERFKTMRKIIYPFLIISQKYCFTVIDVLLPFNSVTILLVFFLLLSFLLSVFLTALIICRLSDIDGIERIHIVKYLEHLFLVKSNPRSPDSSRYR